MKFTLYILFMFLILSACTKGKDCQQLYQKVISFENRIPQNLVLEFIDSGNETFSVEIAASETAIQKVVKEYYKTHEGGFQKGGAPSDGHCTSEPEVSGTSTFLSEKSFGAVKNCWDNTNYKSIIVENSIPCPPDTFEQTRAGRP